MTTRINRNLVLHPDIFNAIKTPPIAPVEAGSVTDGLPSYAKLDVLIAYLTAPTTLNYDTLSDFLMTYRLYATDEEVWYLLASRLLWAAGNSARNGSESEGGRNVGTRCFVLIRMWIRDYFPSDFASNLSLRHAVADTLTAMSGCTEFVLLDHFYRILCQLRRTWEEQICRFWEVPADVLGNPDSAVPYGGDSSDVRELAVGPSFVSSRNLVSLSGKAFQPSPVMNGDIPIDAHCAVPSIQSSPQRRRPRTKLSTFFRGSRHTEHPDEAVLHDKVDMLALQVITEYHLRELEHKNTRPSSVTPDSGSRRGHEGDQTFSSRTTDFGSQRTKMSTDNEVPMPSPKTKTDLTTDASNTAQFNSNLIETPPEGFSTPTPSAYEEDIWATPRKTLSNRWIFPECDCEEQQKISTRNSNSSNADHFQHSEPSEQCFDANGEAENNENSLREDALNITEDELDEEDEDEDDSDFDKPELRPLSDESLAQSHGNTIIHEQSMDTLNMNDMGLANVSGDSEADLDMTDSAAPLTENWNSVDINQFDQVSYSGSSLSTLSTSTCSQFSYHAPPVIASSGTLSQRDRYKSIGSISLLSELDNSLLQPCAGYTRSDAARLKAMPDVVMEGDALLTTLQKLEGTWHTFPPTLPSVPCPEEAYKGIPRSNTIDLYNEALESSAKSSSRGAEHRVRNGNECLANEVSLLGISHSTDEPSPAQQDEYRHIVDVETGRQNGAPNENSKVWPHGGRDEAAELQPTEPRNLGALGVPQHQGRSHSFNRSSGPQQNFDEESNLLEQPDPPKMLPPTLHIGLPGASHAPFILSYTARAVAEQLTFIEREIALQIDTPGLVRMEEKSAATIPKISSWVQAIMEDPPLEGTSLVVARFDLVLRWVKSEILLCNTPALQAQSMSRFIHIAFEALRLQNFATMVQLVLALCSNDVQVKLGDDALRLLPEHDRETLERLESLASPAQNYARLKRAHNRFSWAKGCVPFTPMFLSDIALTAEAASANAEHEIHFGKYRVASQIAKTLQQHIDSAANYDIVREPALLSKCLYLAALPGV